MALFKSLFLIMGIQIGGWMFSSIGFYFVDRGFIKKLNEENHDFIGISINCISSLSSTFEVPAIFLSSSEHLKALRKTFGYETSSTYPMTVQNKVSPNNPIIVQPA
uniref:Secreted protein n=1 Tax=Meloidogyne hapla TaxID=6305 RepID=A0A1I8BUW4_MELHA